MAIAKKCDICGKLYEFDRRAEYHGFSYETMDIKGSIMNSKTLDCCPECMDAIKKCVETLSNKEN